MKQLLLILAVVALVGCGGGGITQCYWCKEDIKKGALICKHCGKSPDSAAENERPDNPSSGGPKNNAAWTSSANESHPDQVSIREVETDKQAFVKKRFVIKGTIELSTYYPSIRFSSGLSTGGRYAYSSERHYAFEIKDGTGTVYAYGHKGKGGGSTNSDSIRNQLLKAPSGRLRGFFEVDLDSRFPHNASPNTFAFFHGPVTEGITDNSKKSDTPETENSGDKQAGKREPEKGSTDDSKPKGSWPWWIYVASFIVACILYKCIEAWKYGTWDPRRREDRKRKIKKREERAERKSGKNNGWFEEHMGLVIFVGFPVALFIIFPVLWDHIVRPLLEWLLP